MAAVRGVIPHSLELVSARRSQIGEGPLRDAARHSLWYFDVLRGLMHRQPVARGEGEVFDLGDMAASAAIVGRRTLLVSLGYGLATFAPESGRLGPIHGIEPAEPRMRVNDGKADPAGRFRAGTMQLEAEPGRGGLYSLPGGWVLRQQLTSCTTRAVVTQAGYAGERCD
jgi:sugar lactone lactonase YvrE